MMSQLVRFPLKRSSFDHELDELGEIPLTVASATHLTGPEISAAALHSVVKWTLRPHQPSDHHKNPRCSLEPVIAARIPNQVLQSCSLRWTVK